MKRDDFQKKYDPKPTDASIQEYVGKLEEENERLKKQVGTDERLFEYIRSGVQAFPPAEPVEYEKPKLKHDDLHAALFITDQHAEESVLSEEMEGLASYNWEIFLERMDITARKTLELVTIMRQASNVNVLDVNCLGDWFTGKIQPQEEGYGTSLTMPVALPKVGRTFPYYPIETTIDMEHKVRAGTNKDFQYVFMGHWHHYAVLDNTTILCPSMIGANQYSRFRLHRRSIPEQLLCFFTKKHGLVTQWPIKLL